MLNAFRHQRFNTFTRMIFELVIFCAQRLSASEIQHVLKASPVTSVALCSTPFGIRDSTLSCLICCFCFQRCSTPFGIRDSTHFLAQELVQVEVWCSTPFGIRDSTLACCRAFDFFQPVLNAFRHQRFNTSTTKNWCCICSVLNAFRHQRFNTRQLHS